jgi:hypothetical protein
MTYMLLVLSLWSVWGGTCSLRRLACFVAWVLFEGMSGNCIPITVISLRPLYRYVRVYNCQFLDVVVLASVLLLDGL